MQVITSVQNDFSNGHIAVMSPPLQVSNVVLCRHICMQRKINGAWRYIQWAGTCPPSKYPFLSGNLDLYVSWFIVVHLQTSSPSIQLFLHNSLFCQIHRHTNHAVCDICSSRP